MRAPLIEDAQAVAAMESAHAPDPYDPMWIEREWTEPGFDLERDARIDGRAYAGVADWHEGKAWIDLQGEPTPELLAWAEARAREKGLVRAHAGSWSGAVRVNRLLERAGYCLVRRSYRMAITLPEPSAEPVWPDGITVRTFRPGDEEVFYELQQETFADHWEFTPSPFDEWAHWLLRPPLHEPELWFLAQEGEEPCGIAICFRRPELRSRGHVAMLGVRRRWRRRGLGRALLLHAFAEFKRLDLTEADLGVDAENLTGAHRLYESVGMYVVGRREIYEKHLT